MAESGSAAVISQSTDGGTTYNDIADLNSITDSNNGGTIETTAFGDAWKSFISGVNDFSFDIGGFWNPSDANGQVALRTAYMNRTKINIKILYDGVNGISGDCYITKFERKASPDGTIDLSISTQGTGQPTDIP